MRILIAEDERKSRKLLQVILSAYGECDAVENGREAVDAFVKAHDEGKPYDLICLDIMMPEMDGHEALRTIRAKEDELNLGWPNGVKIFMVTALDSDKDMISAIMHENCTDYIVKPLEREVLISKLKKYQLID